MTGLTVWRSIAAASIRRPGLVIGVALVASVCCAVYLVGNFSVRTDLDALISRDLGWRKTEAAVERAFPNQASSLTIVIDGKTPELADDAARQLTDVLAKRQDLFDTVSQPEGGAFAQREALLFLPLDDLKETARNLIDAQPIVGPLAADPSLRGVASTIATAYEGTAGNPEKLKDLTPIARAIDHTLRQAKSGKTEYVSWVALVSGQTDTSGSLRRVVATTPKLDYSKISPGEPARRAITDAVANLSTPKDAVTIRITGDVAMSDDELANLSEATGPSALASIAAMLLVMFVGTRSLRSIYAIAVTVVCGLLLTSAFGIAVFHRFTLISVAFLPLFVGLGIDFAIQFVIRFRTEGLAASDRNGAILRAARSAGPGVALAAATTGFGFLAFWPTSYRGVSELGLIAGAGMAIGAVTALTLLPACLKAFKAPLDEAEQDLKPFLAVVQLVEERWRMVIAVVALVVLAALFASSKLGFNFDPLTLRNAQSPSVATYHDLLIDPDTTPNTIQVLATSPLEAKALAERFKRLPTVSQAYSASTFIPSDQPAKLDVIADARTLLDTTLNPFDVAPRPSDPELARALDDASTRIRLAMANTPGAEGEAGRSLADSLAMMSGGDKAVRDRAQAAVIAGLNDALDQLRNAVSAEPVSLETLPPALRLDWVSPSGLHRVEVLPAGNPSTPEALERFVTSVRTITPDVSGTPVTIVESGRTILTAFIQASVISTLAIAALLFVVLHSPRYVVLTVAPISITLLLTIGTCGLFRQAINLENLIALPLLLGIGVSFNIYTVIAWREQTSRLVRASIKQAIVISALTTGAAFSALSFSAHPGTASLGRLLLVSLFWTLVTALVVLPSLLSAVFSPPKTEANSG